MAMSKATEYDMLKRRSKRILGGVRHLWETGLLCDTTLHTEDGSSFAVHRAILVSVSDYFMAMFTHDMKESTTTKDICLKGICGQTLSVLLGYVYTGTLILHRHTVSEVANAAMYLQLEGAVWYCFKFALENLDISNCVDVYNTASMHDFTTGSLAKDLEEKAFEFICSHFDQVLLNNLHYNLSADCLVKCLTKKDEDGVDMVTFGSEFELFKYVVPWCKMNADDSPLRGLRYQLMTDTELDIVRDVVQQEGFQGEDLIKQADQYLSLPLVSQVAHSGNGFQIRNQPCIVTFAHNGTDQNLELFILSSPTGCPSPVQESLTWMRLPQFHTFRPADIAIGFRPVSWTVIRGFLIVYGENANNQLQCFLFNPMDLKWASLGAMNVPCTNCPLVECGGELFVLGGIKQDTSVISPLIEKYCFHTQRWHIVGQMGVGLEGHGACSIENKIYVYGGRQANGKRSHVTYSYEPSTNKWITHNYVNQLPQNNFLRLHYLLSRIHSSESSPMGMANHLGPKTHNPKSPKAQTKYIDKCVENSSHFAVVLPHSVFFIGGGVPEITSQKHRPTQKCNNKCIQIIAKGDQTLGDSVVQPDYPQGWSPCLAVGLTLPCEIVRQAQPVNNASQHK